MKLRAQPVCPCCECEVTPLRAGILRRACPFCGCEFRHNLWHWLVGLPLLAGASYGTWFGLGKAFSGSFALAWPFKLLFAVIGAFLVTWPIIGLVAPYKILKRGDPPKVTPLNPPPRPSQSTTKPIRKAA